MCVCVWELTAAGAMADWDFCGMLRLSMLSLSSRLRASSRARELAADRGTEREREREREREVIITRQRSVYKTCG